MGVTAPVIVDGEGMTVSQLFDQIAAEKSKKRDLLEKFVGVFAEKSINFFEQISLEVVDKMESEKEMPPIICNFVREKVKERTSQTTDFVHKECLIIWQSEYDQLRALDVTLRKEEEEAKEKYRTKTKDMGNLEQAEQDSQNS